MPRRRTTKINVRATPKAPRCIDAEKMSEKDRQEKMRVFLNDFDEKVKIQLEIMENEKKRMLQTVSRRLHVQIMQIPQDVRHMKLRDFIAAGGTIASVMQQQTQMDAVNTSTMCPSKGNLCETILEENQDFAVPKATRGRQKKYGTRASKLRGKENTVKSSFKTPHHGAKPGSWDTPLITPKFDPRLPFVSANSRDPKPGERLVSLQGSPVAISSKNTSCVKLRDNTLTLNVNLTDNLSIDDMDIDLCEDHINKVMAVFSQIAKKLANKREGTTK